MHKQLIDKDAPWYANLNTRVVYIHMALIAEEDGSIPATRMKLAHDVGLSRKQVFTAIKKLEELGAVKDMKLVTGTGPKKEPRAKKEAILKEPKKKGPDPDIDYAIALFREKFGNVMNDSIQKNRNYANLLLEKLQKESPEHSKQALFRSFLNIILRDPFHTKNAGGMRYLYNNAGSIIQAGRQYKKKQDALKAEQQTSTGWQTPKQ